jgi:UDP-N-acetylmuramate--alanine ligase
MYTKLPLTVVFKPHTYTRTASLWGDFVSSLSLADYPVITDIFAAREEPIEGISSQRLASDLGNKAIYCPDYKAIETVDSSTEGAIILMGAGDFKNIRKNILNI